MATKRMNDRWARIRERIKAVWNEADLSNEEMRKTRGSLPKMVSLIHDKTGEPRPEIRRKVAALV
jgi:hypothetical protein